MGGSQGNREELSPRLHQNWKSRCSPNLFRNLSFACVRLCLRVSLAKNVLSAFL